MTAELLADSMHGFLVCISVMVEAQGKIAARWRLQTVRPGRDLAAALQHLSAEGGHTAMGCVQSLPNAATLCATFLMIESHHISLGVCKLRGAVVRLSSTGSLHDANKLSVNPDFFLCCQDVI